MAGVQVPILMVTIRDVDRWGKMTRPDFTKTALAVFLFPGFEQGLFGLGKNLNRRS